ncbi:SDR family NAD(P)-dependent oxidoreductase [Pedobacter jamesrossensis]|uniref:SDR family NAD(P)-dependent oxidoreductase n=1 Tax=Pedobacter jamesrossensis TaxID=1908238 RepID=A0ABV8NKP0_9SPHI
MDLQLKEKVIIITGAAKGIGRAIAEVFANENAIAVIVGRKAEDNQKVVDAIAENGGQAAQFVAELSNPKDCEKVVAEIVAKFGRIDGLVNSRPLKTT